MKKLVLSTALLLALAACNNTSGTKITDDQMNQFTTNKSTMQDVETALGQPTSTMMNNDGTTTLTYTYSNTSIDPTQYIPLVGIATAGAQKQDATVASFIFKNNILISKSKGSSSSKTSGFLGSSQ